MSQIATAAAKADHEILVTLRNHQPVPKVPKNMEVGQTVHFKSNNGEVVTITFQPHHSPFLNSNGNEKLKITSKEKPIKLSKKGKFSFDCLLTPPKGAINPNIYPPTSYPGGNMDVG